MRVADGMRADLEASVRERAELGPVHRLELVGMGDRVRRELGNVERTALVGKGGRGKDRGRHPQALEQVQGPRDARVRVVEGHVQEAPAPVDRLAGTDRLETAIEQALHLTLEGRRPEGQGMAPAVGDRVVAKDERP